MTIRVAALSRWHVHADEYARAIQAHPGAALAALWDEDAARGAEWARAFATPFEPDLPRLLARADIDAVLVTTPTALHREVIVAAANAGKHVFTEKVLAASLDDAHAIAHAVADAERRAGVRFCISFPRQAIGPLRLARRMLDDGEIGRPTLLRIRIAHDGALANWLPERFYDAAAAGGGAMIDLGAHGMYLAAWLLGTPRSITSTFTQVSARAQAHGVEDNAVSVITFDGGAIAINETAFVSGGGSYSVELDGTDGALRMAGPNEPLYVRSRRRGDVRAWTCVEPPPDLPLPIPQWLDAIAAGAAFDAAAFEFGMAPALTLTALMQAAYRSHREGCSVPVPLASAMAMSGTGVGESLVDGTGIVAGPRIGA